MTNDYYMYRCLELAKLGAGYVAPNPMVGAVLVHEGRIIGEGWHQAYGEAHAEVNCIGQAVQDGFAGRINQSCLFVSLEPCVHFGKTPPCTDLIMNHKIPEVVTGCADPFREVAGKGIEKLRQAGVNVTVGVLEKECEELNKRFFTFHTQHRPYIILKWAQTSDGYIAASHKSFPKEGINGDSGSKRLLISNDYSNRLVHKWRSEESAILIGTNTALLDDPELTTRIWPGNSPVRLVVDMELKLPHTLNLFNRQQPTIVFNAVKHDMGESISSPSLRGSTGVGFYQVTKDAGLVYQVLNALNQLKIQSVLVEGGARLLQSFIDEGMWDEARKIENRKLKIQNGLPAPQLPECLKTEEINLFNDKIEIFKRLNID